MHRAFGADAAYYALAQARGDRRLRRGVGDGAAAGRRDRRARRRADHRRPALLPLHRGQVQSRRHPAAVLGAGRLRFPCRAQARPHSAHWLLLGFAFGSALWAKYFVVVLGGALRAVSHFRPRRAPRLGDARALARARSSRWSSPRRMWSGWSRPIFCRSPMPSTAPRTSRGWSTISGIRLQFVGSQIVLPAAVVVHCRAAAVAGSPPPCGEGLGVGVARCARASTRDRTSRPPTLPSATGARISPTLSTAAS